MIRVLLSQPPSLIYVKGGPLNSHTGSLTSKTGRQLIIWQYIFLILHENQRNWTMADQDFSEVGRQLSRERQHRIRYADAWGEAHVPYPIAWLVGFFVIRLEFILAKKNTPSSHTKILWMFLGTTALGPSCAYWGLFLWEILNPPLK